MKTILSISAFLLFSIMAYGQSVVGAWSTQVPMDDQGNMMTLKFVMNDDNTYTYQEGNQPADGATYVIKDNEIHFKVDNEECQGTVICEFEVKDASTLYLKPKVMPCGDGSVPPPLTLKKQ